jgi:UDP-glucose 4-epimerase
MGRLPDLPATADAVIYLAQSERFRDFPDGATDMFAVNTAGAAQMLEYARRSGCRTFVYASTGGVYAPRSAAVDEEAPLAPTSSLGFYAATKLAAEQLAQQYSALFDVVVLRFFFVYGRGQQSHMLVPRLIASVREGRSIQLAGNDGIRINPTHVDDAVCAVTAALDKRTRGTVNVAGPEVVSLRALAGIIGEAVGREPVFAVKPDQAPRDLVADTTRMASQLVAPAIAPRDGIRRTIA